jgi:hypothetical protein
MKNILKKIIFLSLGLGLIASCLPTNRIINYGLKNNSDKLIYYGYSFSYPDISLKSITEFVPKKNSAYRIDPGRVQSQSLGYFVRNSTMQIFIFDADVIEKTPWDTIVKYNKFLKRYQFTQSELEKMNYEIIYDEN